MKTYFKKLNENSTIRLSNKEVYNANSIDDFVYVKRTADEMEAREEYNSHLWDLVKSYPKGINLYKIPIRDLKIGENIYTKDGKFIAYRVE